MALTRAAIADGAMAILSEFGLGDLSMRRLARDLGVQPSALYWHVKNKQDVFVLLAERMAGEVDAGFAGHAGSVDGAGPLPDADLSGGLRALRRVLLKYRDGAEIFSAAYALAGQRVVPVIIRSAVADESWLDVLLGYVLGYTALEQNRELFAAGAKPPVAHDGTGGTQPATASASTLCESDAAFADGLARLVGGGGL